MALTDFQRNVCRLIAHSRIASGESYVAGAAAPNELLAVEHQDLGLTLHPFDLATNKVLALVGRLEVRDWVDTIECDGRLQPLGYLAWAACGKDPGFSPVLILQHAARSHYSADEVNALSFAGPAPDAADLSRRWHSMLATADEIVAALPHDESGKCVLSRDGTLFTGMGAALGSALETGAIHFHSGSIRGAFPQLAHAQA